MFSNIIINQYLFMFVLIIGILCLVLEVFIPSFGLVGMTGIYLIVNAIGAMPMIENPFVYMLIAFFLAMVLAYILIKIILSKNSVNKLVLDTQLDFSSADLKSEPKIHSLVGKQGYVIKPLRPSGLAIIDGDNYDVISFGEFIPKGETIVVVKIEGNNIYCRRMD